MDKSSSSVGGNTTGKQRSIMDKFEFFVLGIADTVFTSWVDENHVSPIPVAAYGISLFMVVVSYRILELVLFHIHDADALLVRILRPGRREKFSMIAFCIAVPLAFVHPFVSLGIYIIIAIIWFMPERALEHALMRGEDTGK